MRPDQKIPVRASHILNLFIVGLILIFVRVWFLAVVQKEQLVEESLKPKRRTVSQHIERATIRDRYNIPLAINKIQYNAAVCYTQIRQIPRFTWEREEGKKVKKQTRLAYIQELSRMLAAELDLDSSEIEDIIHAKASLFPHTPFVIKEEISEEDYYRLKMLERKWHGVVALRSSKRFYPYKSVSADIIGYLGAISEQEYRKIAGELKELTAYIKAREEGELAYLPKGYNTPLEVRQRLNYLKNKSYTINDLVGKGGIEKALDAQLRGKNGRKRYEIDTNGNFLRELPGTLPAVAGRRAVLSISLELQEYAESLLSGYEYEKTKKDDAGYNQPWIRGGAIVAMKPKTGEILTLASHPGFDPNDFITTGKDKEAKQIRIQQWLENDALIARIWNGECPISKELFHHKNREFFTQGASLSWNTYINAILNPKSAIACSISTLTTLKQALSLQHAAHELLTLSNQDSMRALIDVLYHSEQHLATRNQTSEQTRCAIRLYLNDHPEKLSPLRTHLDTYLSAIPHNDDKVLLLDLCQLAAHRDDFSKGLTSKISHFSLEQYRLLGQKAHTVRTFLYTTLKDHFHKTTFATWRSDHFKAFLKEKRKSEKERKRAAKPYTDYLKKEEMRQFLTFWKAHKEALLYTFIQGEAPLKPTEEFIPYSEAIASWRKSSSIPQETYHTLSQILSSLPINEGLEFLRSLRPFEELTTPLWGRYPRVRQENGIQMTKHLARAFYPLSGFGHGRSFAFRQSTPAGSVFKVITGYEALRQKYQENKKARHSIVDINPLTLIDSLHWAPKNIVNSRIMGYMLDGTPIKRLYKRGLLPRGHANIGKIDLPGAFENSSNIYFSILAGDHLNHPTDLAKAAKRFGYGEITGIDLPGEIYGNLPDDLADNRTGLYSFAIGQHSLVATPLQTAVMLSAFANKGTLLKPKIIRLLASVEPAEKKPSLFNLPDYAFSEPLSLVGITFPFFTEAKKAEEKPLLHFEEPEVKRSVFLPYEIQHILLKGMYRVVHASKGTARNSLIRARHAVHSAAKDYAEISPYLIGKTGTAEFYYKPTLDAETKAEIRNHIWFGTIAYPNPVSENGPWDDPELVVVVYLQHGDTGRNAAPIGAQIVKKYREIISKHHPQAAPAP